MFFGKVWDYESKVPPTYLQGQVLEILPHLKKGSHKFPFNFRMMKRRLFFCLTRSKWSARRWSGWRSKTHLLPPCLPVTATRTTRTRCRRRLSWSTPRTQEQAPQLLQPQSRCNIKASSASFFVPLLDWEGGSRGEDTDQGGPEGIPGFWSRCRWDGKPIQTLINKPTLEL